MLRRLAVLAALIAIGAPQPASARWRHHRRVSGAQTPLPPERPMELGANADAPPAPVETPAQEQEQEQEALAYAAPVEPERDLAPPFVAPLLSGEACLRQLKQAGVMFEEAAQPHAMLGGCHIDTPVQVSSVPVDGRMIGLPAKPLLDCAYVLHFADFVARHAAPLGPRTMRATLVALDTGPGYECRGRNRVRGARVSAHGKGIALDVSGFIFQDGRKVVVEGQRDHATHAYFDGLRKGACGWFTTVLGPGSDGYHERHLHLDTEAHGRHGMHYCH